MEGYADGDKTAEQRMRKREADQRQREQEGSLLMRGVGMDYRVNKDTAIRGTASATLSGGGPKIRGFKVELKKEF